MPRARARLGRRGGGEGKEAGLGKSLLSHIQLFAIPLSVAQQASLSMEFSGQEYWRGVPFPPPGDLSNPGVEPASLASPTLEGRFFTAVPPGEA